MIVAHTILDAIGRTPLVKLNKVTEGTSAEIWCKLEYFNPSGSLKDRIYKKMIEEAEKRGELKPGMTILEASTGNAGIAAAFVGAVKGYKVIICMPEGMSEERKKTMRAYGADLIFTPGGESDVDLVIAKVQEIKASAPDKYWIPAQFDNPDNWRAHYETTAPEIWEQTGGGKFDAFIVSEGTGGTFTGISRFIRERSQRHKLYVVEPAECPLLAKGEWGSHRIEGVGDGFIPLNLDVSLIEGIVMVTSSEAIEMGKQLALREAIFCGISSGANVMGALKLHKKHPELRRIITLINDNGQRYFSTALCGVEKELEVPERDHPMDARTKENWEKYHSRWEIIS